MDGSRQPKYIAFGSRQNQVTVSPRLMGTSSTTVIIHLERLDVTRNLGIRRTGRRHVNIESAISGQVICICRSNRNIGIGHREHQRIVGIPFTTGKF